MDTDDKNTVWALALAGVFIFGWWAWPAADPAAEAERALKDNKGSAAVACQGFVTKRLKSPGSADFPWSFGEVTNVGGKFTVRSHVDSQNSYGALLRTNYVCTVEDRGESWFLVEMDLSER